MSSDKDEYGASQSSNPIETSEEKRLFFRLRSLVIFLYGLAIVIVLVLIYAARTGSLDKPAIVVAVCTLSASLTTVLGSIIGTSIK